MRRSSGPRAGPGSGTGVIGYPAAVTSRATTIRSRARTTSFCGFGPGLGALSVMATNPARQEAPAMEPAPARPRHEAIGHDDLLVHQWPVMQPTRLGIPLGATLVRRFKRYSSRPATFRSSGPAAIRIRSAACESASAREAASSSFPEASACRQRRHVIDAPACPPTPVRWCLVSRSRKAPPRERKPNEYLGH